jgi:hypothetical protein
MLQIHNLDDLTYIIVTPIWCIISQHKVEPIGYYLIYCFIISLDNGFEYPYMNIQIRIFLVLGESTLWWPPLGCHIILLCRDVHVWIYPTSNFWRIFIMILHIMLEYNLGKRLENKLFYFIL